jgi:ribosome-binding protein aMBF1 (putative translation factor)
MSRIHTDFDSNPVVLRRTLTKSEKVKNGIVRSESKHITGNKTSSDIDKRKVEAGLIGPPKMPHDLSQAISKARTDKKLTRDQLAQKLAVSKDVITKLETPGTLLSEINNLTLLFTKLNKVLGTSFKKPKNTVLVPED